MPSNSQILRPRLLSDKDVQRIACVTNTGRLLVFAANQLPELARGKGNKLMNIPAAKAALREEFVIDVQAIGAEDSLVVHAGKRHFTLKPADLAHYEGERGRRGNRLPRGLQNVTALALGD